LHTGNDVMCCLGTFIYLSALRPVLLAGGWFPAAQVALLAVSTLWVFPARRYCKEGLLRWRDELLIVQ
jgi:hypothetical protein